MFQVEAIRKAAVQILEVRVGKETNLRRATLAGARRSRWYFGSQSQANSDNPRIAVPAAELHALGRGCRERNHCSRSLAAVPMFGFGVNVPTAQVPMRAWLKGRSSSNWPMRRLSESVGNLKKAARY